MFTISINFATIYILLSIIDNKLKNVKPEFNRITIKVGSNVITRMDGSLNDSRILRIVEDIAVLYRQGVEVLLITSGAVAAGRGNVTPSRKTNIVAARQVWAAIGQVQLMSSYQFLFGKYGIQAGQLLATKDSFRDRRNYLNMKNCISAMLENRVLPIVNENDAISVNELMFTDNDELSGLISSMMDSQSLIILTNVDGIYSGSPDNEESKLIRYVDKESDSVERYISSAKSGLGRGGMLTKYSIAKKIAAEGIDVFIANGLRDSIIADIVGGKDVPYTRFLAGEQKETGVKRWLYHSDTFAKGSVVINNGAKEALMGDRATSLLMIGITGVNGFFRKGDIVRIIDEDGNYLGLGQAQYDSEKTMENLGVKLRKPFIHYDYLFIYEKNKGMIHHKEDLKTN